MTVVVFDLGNVMYRWEPEAALSRHFENHQAMFEALANVGFYDWNREQDRGRDWDDAVNIASASHPDFAHVFAAYRNGLAAAHRTPILGSIEILRSLHRAGVPVYAITNASFETMSIVRELHDFLDLFRDVVISAIEGVLKPDPEIFQRFLARNQLAAEQCIFVDDVVENVIGAGAVGMRGIRFISPETLREALWREGIAL